MDPVEILGLKLPGKLLVMLPLAFVASCPILAIVSISIDEIPSGYPPSYAHFPPTLAAAYNGLVLLLPWLTVFTLLWWGPRPKQRRGRLFLTGAVIGWLALLAAYQLDWRWGCVGTPPSDQLLYLCDTTNDMVVYYSDPDTPAIPERWRLRGITPGRAVKLERSPQGGTLRVWATNVRKQPLFCQDYTPDDVTRLKARIDIVAGAVNC
jgi:hypothetical protein